MSEQKDSNNPEPEASPIIWGGVTSPNQHNSRNFRYTVYGINPVAKLYMPDLGIDFMKQDMASGVGVSMSLIDQNHIGTWGNVGLIIEIPRENMIAASSSDLGSGGTSAEWLRKTGQQY